MGYTINDSDNRYNGWTNYATWRVRLEIFDGFDPSDLFGDFRENDVDALAECLKDYADEAVTGEAPEGLAADYARAFLSDVNWYEIAEHMVADFKSEAAA